MKRISNYIPVPRLVGSLRTQEYNKSDQLFATFQIQFYPVFPGPTASFSTYLLSFNPH